MELAADFKIMGGGGEAGGVPVTRIIATTAPLTGGGDLSADRTLVIAKATAAVDGYLAAEDFTTFNAKQNALEFGDLTEATSSVLTIVGGTGSVIGTGTTIEVKKATAAVDGYLAAEDFTTFDAKQNALEFGDLAEATSSVLTIVGGIGSVIGTGTTIEVKKATAAVDGYLAATDWTTFNSKIGGSGTVGNIPKFSAANTLADSVITETAGKVGIGTTEPTTTLDVNGTSTMRDSVTLTTGRLILPDGAFGAPSLGFSANAYTGIRAFGSSIWISAGPGANPYVYFGGSDAPPHWWILNATNSNLYPADDNFGNIGNANHRVADLYVSNNVRIGTGASPETVITSTGNSYFAGKVTIGTTEPANKLDVRVASAPSDFNRGISIISGDGTFTTGHGGMLQFQNEDVITAGIRGIREAGWASGLGFYTHNSSGGNTFGTTFLERMRIDNTGNVGIGTASPNAAAILHLNSTTGGFLPPQMTTTQRNAISSPPAGLMIYNTTTHKLNFYNGTAWEQVTSA